MAYASASDVQNEFKNVDFTQPSSAVTTAKVTEWIGQAEAEINAKVGMVYQVPVDSGASPNSTLILKAISIGIVAQRVRDVLQVKTPDQETSQGARKDSAKDARTRLDAIVNRTLPLPDAVLISSTNGATDYDVGDTTVEFSFQRGTGSNGGPNQW